MKKMPSLFVRDFAGDGKYTRDVHPDADWVVRGEGVATWKIDGTCCLVRDGVLYKRYDAKHGKKPPEGFEPCQPEPDANTGHWPGWLRVGDEPESRWHREAWDRQSSDLTDGTYELVGPKVNANREDWDMHQLLPHGCDIFRSCPRTFDDLRDWLSTRDIEGVVWHHPDGRMVKATKEGFRLPRKPEVKP